jgi:tRNA A37 threonylcarbamoyladenosine modification protein TsaB
LAKAVAKGSLQLAPSKESRDTSSFAALKSNKGKKGKKNTTAAAADAGGQVDFAMIKRFANLRIQAPLADDSHDATILALKELKEALIYWGKILQR